MRRAEGGEENPSPAARRPWIAAPRRALPCPAAPGHTEPRHATPHRATPRLTLPGPSTVPTDTRRASGCCRKATAAGMGEVLTAAGRRPTFDGGGPEAAGTRGGHAG